METYDEVQKYREQICKPEVKPRQQQAILANLFMESIFCGKTSLPCSNLKKLVFYITLKIPPRSGKMEAPNF